jgi:hypothetical protein
MIGCQNIEGEVCFGFTFMTYIGGIQLSGLSFGVDGPISNLPSGSGTPVVLGPGASLTVLSNDQKLVGVWNWTHATWSLGGNWTIPTGLSATFVLDTGEQNVQFAGDYFSTSIVTPSYGSGSVPL